jgi:hypothetical protein
MSKAFLQGVNKMFIVSEYTSNWRAAAQATLKNAFRYSCDIPVSCIRYYTRVK